MLWGLKVFTIHTQSCATFSKSVISGQYCSKDIVEFHDSLRKGPVLEDGEPKDEKLAGVQAMALTICEPPEKRVRICYWLSPELCLAFVSSNVVLSFGTKRLLCCLVARMLIALP